jgi:glycosyltransferase involved in cell wall biosynthesis
MYPTPSKPTYGSFVEAQLTAIVNAGVAMEVEFINGRAADWNYVRGVAQVRRLARRGNFDLVHAHYGLCGFVCAPQPLPLVVSFWGDDLLGTPNGRGALTWKSRVIRRMSFLAARRADAINCESEEMRAQLPRVVDRQRAHVIPNGVDVRRFSPGDRAAARSRLGLDPQERLVLFPSTPTERRKRLDLAMAATERLTSAGMPARLWIVQGTPPAEMPNCYRAADCLLLTSDWEGSANVVKEAICCDLPVVSVDAGDAARWVALTPGCQLVPRDPEAITAGLRSVLSASGRIDGSRVRETLRIDRTAAALVEVYREAIAHRRATITAPGDTARHTPA